MKLEKLETQENCKQIMIQISFELNTKKNRIAL